MKKKMLFVIALLCTFFLPSVVLAAPEYIAEKDLFLANGTEITIEERTDGVDGALIKWDGGEQLVTAKTWVFGGSHNTDVVVEKAVITMNSGKVKNINGGGLHKSITESVEITINGGKITGNVNGGGAHYAGNYRNDGDFIESSVAEAKNRDTAVTIVDEVEIYFNGGEAQGVYGGGESYSYTGTANVYVYGGKIGWLIAGGSNGYTGEGNLYIYDGEITVAQGVNRGEMDTVTTEVYGGKIEALYGAGETPDSGVTGTVNNSVYLNVTGGDVAKIDAGTSGANKAPATDITTLTVNKTLEDVVTDTFDEENTEVVVNLTLIWTDTTETIQIPYGTTFTEEELQELIDEINESVAEEGLEFVGFYLDEDYTEEFDFSEPVNEDLELYLRFIEKKEVTNPETSDINLYLILSLIAVGAFGTALVLKNRLS